MTNRIIKVFGKSISIDAVVHLWDDALGFDAYDRTKFVHTEENRKTGKIQKRVVKGRRYSWRKRKPDKIKSIVIHHTGGLRADTAFNTLHRERGLSVHFIVDDKGRIYQTLDLDCITWHAGKANATSVGIEACLYPDAFKRPNMYSPERCRRFGVMPHDIDYQIINGSKRRVFLMPDIQVRSIAKLCAAIWQGLERADSPEFPTDIGCTYYPLWREHEGLLLHSHITPRKWDAVGFDLARLRALVKNHFWGSMPF